MNPVVPACGADPCRPLRLPMTNVGNGISELGDGRLGAMQAACGRVLRGPSLSPVLHAFVQDWSNRRSPLGKPRDEETRGRGGHFRKGLNGDDRQGIDSTLIGGSRTASKFIGNPVPGLKIEGAFRTFSAPGDAKLAKATPWSMKRGHVAFRLGFS